MEAHAKHGKLAMLSSLKIEKKNDVIDSISGCREIRERAQEILQMSLTSILVARALLGLGRPNGVRSDERWFYQLKNTDTTKSKEARN